MGKVRETVSFTYEDDDGFEVEVELPGRFEVCGRCDGRGSHANPSIDSNGITADEWNGPDWSDEDKETYLSGGYDVPCEECKGQRVLLEVDEDRTEPELLERWHQHLNAEAEERRERASAARWGY